MSVNEIAQGYEAYDGVKPLPADATPDFIKGWKKAVWDASLVDGIKERLAKDGAEQLPVEQSEIDRARRLLHEEEGAELLAVIHSLMHYAVLLDSESAEITDVSWQGEGDTEILLRFKGKAFAVGVERF